MSTCLLIHHFPANFQGSPETAARGEGLVRQPRRWAHPTPSILTSWCRSHLKTSRNQPPDSLLPIFGRSRHTPYM
jgi:hypothetical protein